MTIHTLIPNANTYGLMTIAMLSLGSFNIARHIHIRWLALRYSLIASNAIIKTILVFIGLTIIPFQQMIKGSIANECLFVATGIIFGLFVIIIEMNLLRKMNRQRLIKKQKRKIQNENQFLRNANISQTLTLTTTKIIKPKGFQHIRKNSNDFVVMPDFLNYSLTSVIIVAIAEEFLFRGFLFSIAFMFQTFLISAIIILTSVIFFAFSHVSRSWNEFFCKLPLSIFTSIGFLITNSLITAITTHIFLNIYAYVHVKKSMVNNFNGRQ